MGREASGQLELDLWGLSPTAAEEQIAASRQNDSPADAAGTEQDNRREDGGGEPLRRDRAAPLGELRAEPDGGVGGPDPVLHRPGPPGAGAGGHADGDIGRGRLLAGDLSGEGRPASEREADSRGDRDGRAGVDQGPGAGAGSGPRGVGADPALRREPDQLGRAHPGPPRLDALDRRAGRPGEDLGAERGLPFGAGGQRAAEGVHAGQPGGAFRGGDDPLPARAAPSLEPAARFVPASQDDLAPKGRKARFQANLAAIRLARALAGEDRQASVDEQRVLARWSSWGAIPDVFDNAKDDWSAERAELRGLLSDAEWDAAARTTINAHYTDPLIARQMWRTMQALGFEHGTVLEPGSGAGTFIGLAPEAAQMTGVELDPLTASISAAIYPQASIRAESFADTRLPEGSFDAAIGNVPFGNVTLHDPVHNGTRQSMHNHFILKSLALTRPGGLMAVLTSHYTMDAQNPGARREMAELADLLDAVRLPTGAHRRAAGSDVVTDLLILRRREPD